MANVVSQFTEKWINLPPKSRLIFSSLALTIFFIGGFLILCWPCCQSVAALKKTSPKNAPTAPDKDPYIIEAQAEITGLENRIREIIKKNHNHLIKLDSDGGNLDAEINAAISHVFDNRNLTMLEMKQLGTIEATDIPEGLHIQSTSYQVNGTYFNLLDALNEINGLPYYFKINRLLISLHDKSNSLRSRAFPNVQQGPVAPAKLLMNMRVDIFCQNDKLTK